MITKLLNAGLLLVILLAQTSAAQASSVMNGIVVSFEQGSRVQTLTVRSSAGKEIIFWISPNTKFQNLTRDWSTNPGIIADKGVPVKVLYEPDGEGFGSAREVRLDASPGSIHHTLSLFVRMDFTEFEREARVSSLSALEGRYPFLSREFLARYQKSLVTEAVEPVAPRVIKIGSKRVKGSVARVTAESALWRAKDSQAFSTVWAYDLVKERGAWRIHDIQYRAD
jgi:hypothetical protein